jgi:hypothetical protein
MNNFPDKIKKRLTQTFVGFAMICNTACSPLSVKPDADIDDRFSCNEADSAQGFGNPDVISRVMSRLASRPCLGQGPETDKMALAAVDLS